MSVGDIAVSAPTPPLSVRARAALSERLQAVIDAGKPKRTGPSWPNRRVWELVARHPDLMPWVNRIVSAANGGYQSAVIRRMAMLGGPSPGLSSRVEPEPDAVRVDEARASRLWRGVTPSTAALDSPLGL